MYTTDGRARAQANLNDADRFSFPEQLNLEAERHNRSAASPESRIAAMVRGGAALATGPAAVVVLRWVCQNECHSDATGRTSIGLRAIHANLP